MQILVFALVILKWYKLLLICIIFILSDVNQVTIKHINYFNGYKIIYFGSK